MHHSLVRWSATFVLIATLGAVDHGPTLTGSTYDVSVAIGSIYAPGNSAPVRNSHVVSQHWTFKDGLILVHQEDGNTTAMPYVHSRTGNTIHIEAVNDQDGINIDAIVDGRELRGTGTFSPRIKSMLGKPLPTITITGNPGEPRLEGSDMLAKAKTLQLQRKTKEALPLFSKIIDEQESNIDLSLPAFLGMVECRQLLAGDQAAMQECAAVAARHHLTMPALGGSASIDPEKAREELLWGEIGDGHGLEWRETDARWFTIKNGDAVRRYLDISISCGSQSGPRLDAEWSTATATAIAPDGTSYQSSSAGTSESGGLTILHRRFDALPEKISKFSSLDVSITLTKPKRWERSTVQLQQGKTWENPLQKGAIIRISETKDEVEVEVQVQDLTSKNPDDRPISGSTSSSHAGQMKGQVELAESGSHKPFLLQGTDGVLLAPYSGSFQGRGATRTETIRFAKPFAAFACTALVSSTIAERHSHIITASIKNIDLP